MMRVISGAARGHRLKAPAGATRPATDRTREAVFSMIGDTVQDATILDLFCGSGAYALEALSRGARHAHLVDRARRVEPVLRGNCDHPAFSGRTTIHRMDVKAALELLGRATDPPRFDLVFADPPYDASSDPESLRAILPLETLVPLIAPGGLLVLERSKHSGELESPAGAGTDALEMIASRCYGNSRIEIFRRT